MFGFRLHRISFLASAVFGVSICGAFQALAAQPVIDSIAGVVANGTVVTIHGSSLGTKKQGPPLKYDNFENGTVGQNLGNGWQTSGSADAGTAKLPAYDNSKPRGSSSKSVMLDFTTVPTQYGCQFGLWPYNPGTKLYISAWAYMTTTGGETRNMKPIRIWGDYPYNPVSPYELIGSTGFGGGWRYPCVLIDYMWGATVGYSGLIQVYSVPSKQTTKWVPDGMTKFPKDKWVHWELYADAGTPGLANGSAYWYQDGVIAASMSNIEMLPVGYNWTQIMIGHYFAVDSNGAHCFQWWDDVYIDNTRARVEISNSATWAGAIHREIQIPSSWSASDIAITVNLGSFSPSDTLYLYVVDSDGNVNSMGYALTKGS